MRIKISKMVGGIPRARAVVVGGNFVRRQSNAAPYQVNVFVSSLDAFDIPTAVASLRMTPDEAMTLAGELISMADKAKGG